MSIMTLSGGRTCRLLALAWLMAVGLTVAAGDSDAQDRPVGGQADIQAGAPVQPQGAANACRITGRVVSGATPLPGVAIAAAREGVPALATSTGLDGRYTLAVPAGQYTLTAVLTGFDRVERSIDVSQECPPMPDLQLAVTGPAVTAPAPARGRGAGGVAGAAGGRGRGAGARFEALAIERQTSADPAGSPEADADEGQAAQQLALPPGFAAEATDAVAITGDTASVDRGQLGDRLDALARGEFVPPPGDLAGLGSGGFGPPPGAAPGGAQGGAGPGGFGGAGGGFPGRPGGPGLGGRGTTQRPYSFSTGYTFGGAVLDAAPYQLRPESRTSNPDYTRQNLDLSFGGPVKIPGLYDGTRRTTFTLNYARNRGATLFDQYATVPTDAMRAGDFSASAVPIVDPATGVAFAGNQIPAERLDPSAQFLLQFIPVANLPGTSRNFRSITTTDTSSDNLNVRLTHNFTPGAAVGGRGGGGGGGGGGRGRGAGPAQGTSASLNAQIQYRGNDNERINVFPTLGGVSVSSSFTMPLNLNVTRNRQLHRVNVNLSRTHADTLNHYAAVQNVAGLAGIAGVATNPFNWGVPTLSFGSISNVNDLTPSRRTDTRTTLGYSWQRPAGRHTLRIGGEWRRDRTSSYADANANGTFVFTGLYSGSDVADFLLGTPQQASVHFGPGTVGLLGRSASLFVQDDWRARGGLTFNLGVRYELIWPLVETGGSMVNLDAAPDFSAVAPVTSGGTGPYSGPLPDALVRTDINNIAPRVGVAWRRSNGIVIRAGYGVSFNSGSYASIARQLSAQPPFSVTSTAIGSEVVPLHLADPFAEVLATDTANNYGVVPDYQLGRVQTMNVDLSKDLTRTWTAGAGYTFAAGSSLDLVRAPNRGPDGLSIDGAQPFLWQTSESSSRLNSMAFRLRRRAVRGIGGGLTYTLARSRDDASTIGGGATVVAQDDQNLGSEWGLSSFDRRHQLSGTANVELPFGPNRRWLNGGGPWAALLESWSAALTFTAQSGTPLTPRVLSSASDAARGTNGTLRADYNGQPIALPSPSIDRFFNIEAFGLPDDGSFGSAGRNIIVGPGSRDLSAQLSRDVRLGGTRSLSVQLRASNLLNLVNYSGVDTVVNSPSFGQVTSVRPMRSVQLFFRFRY
jgi:hypothetical protein